MYEYPDGKSSNEAEWTQNVAGGFSTESEYCISFGDHNESLQNRETGNTIDLQTFEFHLKLMDTFESFL